MLWLYLRIRGGRGGAFVDGRDVRLEGCISCAPWGLRRPSAAGSWISDGDDRV